MPVKGIDYDKCINCGICITACSDPERFFKKDKEQDKVIFEDPESECAQCGQCIAQCPENAIIYEDMGESFTFENIESPEKYISYDKIFNFLSANRSTRKYKKEKVPTEILKKVFKAMQRAPTAANMRTEDFTIISDEEKIKLIADAIGEVIKTDPSLKNQFSEQLEIYGKYYDIPLYYDAPHLIFVTSRLNMMMEGYNIGNIVTYGRLAAQALGLGTCWNGWTQLAIHVNPKIKRLAKIKGNVIAAFIIGYPDVKFYRIPPRSMKKVRGLE
jgi:nitroreductase/NAD-dependent dihydropyrimidine dehydrogenase PreA subunit